MFSKLVFITLYLACSQAEWPSEIQRCVVGDLDCLVDAANDFVRDFKNGYEKLGIPELDPYIIQNFTFNEDDRSPIRLTFYLPTAKILGLSDIKFDNAIGWGLDVSKSKYELYGRIPRLELKGQYQADGVIIFAPIQGTGDFHVILDDVEIGMKFKSVVVERNGRPYIVINKIKGILEPKNGKGFLTGLFGNNKQLSDALNDLLNSNWRAVWDELVPHLANTIENVIKSSMQPFLDKYSWDEFFLPV